MMNQTLGFVTMTDHQLRIERVNQGAWMTEANSSPQPTDATERSSRMGLSSVLERMRARLNAPTLAPVR
jgi:hypothetical protein